MKHSIARIVVIALTIFSLVLITTVAQAELRNAKGKISMLRVHEVGTGYGPQNDKIDVEVVIKLANMPDNAFGFKLRNDNNQAVHQGMLDLFRDAFDRNWNVNIDYNINPGKKNGVILRVWLTK